MTSGDHGDHGHERRDAARTRTPAARGSRYPERCGASLRGRLGGGACVPGRLRGLACASRSAGRTSAGCTGVANCRAASGCWSGARPGRIGDRCDDAILELGGRARPTSPRPRAALRSSSSSARSSGVSDFDVLAGQIRDPVLVASAQEASFSVGDAAERQSAPLRLLRSGNHTVLTLRAGGRAGRPVACVPGTTWTSSSRPAGPAALRSRRVCSP